MDESYHQGRCRCGRGRLIIDDKEDNDKTLGAWVVSLCASNDDVRLELVPNRTYNVLLLLKKHSFQEGRTDVTYEWRVYSRLRYHSHDYCT